MRTIDATFLDAMPTIAYGAAGLGTARAVHFNGLDTILYRASALTGVSNGRLGFMSLFFRTTSDATAAQQFFSLNTLNGSSRPDTAGQKFATYFEANPLRLMALDIVGAGGVGVDELYLESDTVANLPGGHLPDSLNNGTWRHLMYAWDTNHASGSKVGQLAIDGTVIAGSYGAFDFASDPGAAFNVLYNSAGSVVGGVGFTGTVADDLWPVDLAEIYVNFDQTLALTTPSNIAKFRNAATGKAVDLGADGSTPTGSAPAIYLGVAAAGSAASFAVNKGTGGDFTIGGTLALANSSPF